MENYAAQELMLSFGKTKQRLVFYQIEYTEEEKEKIQEFKVFCQSKGVKIPNRDAEILKWLYGKGWSVQKAYDGLIAKIEWQGAKLPMNVSGRVFELLNLGFIYICGRDRFYRPIIVVRSPVIAQMMEQPTEDDMVTAAMIVMEYIHLHMHIPGRIENNIQINDSMHEGLMGLPVMKVKAVLQTLQLNYKCKARTIFAVNAPATITFLWNTIRYFIDENTAKKVQITSSNIAPELIEMCHPTQIEQKYGGSQPDREIG